MYFQTIVKNFSEKKYSEKFYLEISFGKSGSSENYFFGISGFGTVAFGKIIIRKIGCRKKITFGKMDSEKCPLTTLGNSPSLGRASSLSWFQLRRLGFISGE